jgi:hypothetical protein
MRGHLLVAATLALAATVTSANALSIVNTDKANHAIMAKPNGGKVHEFVIKARQTGHINCAKGCELQLGVAKTHFDGKIHKIWIKSGKFVSA